MATHARTQFPNPKIGDGSVLIPSSCPSCGDVEPRLAWFDAKLFPAWKVWRARAQSGRSWVATGTSRHSGGVPEARDHGGNDQGRPGQLRQGAQQVSIIGCWGHGSGALRPLAGHWPSAPGCLQPPSRTEAQPSPIFRQRSRKNPKIRDGSDFRRDQAIDPRLKDSPANGTSAAISDLVSGS